MHSHLLTFFFFNTTYPTEFYTLSLHDALPIYVMYEHSPELGRSFGAGNAFTDGMADAAREKGLTLQDRKSTRLNSSHEWISYAVFCLKKKNKKIKRRRYNRIEYLVLIQ